LCAVPGSHTFPPAKPPPRRQPGAADSSKGDAKDETMEAPIPAQKAPYNVMVEAGKRYFWCACGRSTKQPYCDGSHQGTGLTPVPFTAEASEEVWLCGCKSTAGRPFCDGTHEGL
jgi:CDGSH-type Zn-finger protein